MENKEKEEKEIYVPEKRNNLKTKLLPSLFMLSGGTIALIICLLQKLPMTEFLLVLFLALLGFAILGTIVKSIVDQFNMNMNYMDYFEENGDLVEKGNNDDF
ncbi:MAG: hypothetical protein IKO10_05215 [Lachnospiraceae bacterium]|nr:hypothetical protein [Lachnospiraceae bacterium]